MIVYQVSLNFVPVKEILKIRWQIYNLMKNVIIMSKIQVTMHIFTLPFFNHRSLNPDRKKKTCGNDSHEKVTTETYITYVHVLADDLLHFRIGNLDWCKCGHGKNEAREIDCLCCREVDTILIALAKISVHEGSISPSSFYGQLPDC